MDTCWIWGANELNGWGGLLIGSVLSLSLSLNKWSKRWERYIHRQWHQLVVLWSPLDDMDFDTKIVTSCGLCWWAHTNTNTNTITNTIWFEDCPLSSWHQNQTNKWSDQLNIMFRLSQYISQHVPFVSLPIWVGPTLSTTYKQQTINNNDSKANHTPQTIVLYVGQEWLTTAFGKSIHSRSLWWNYNSKLLFIIHEEVPILN